MSTTTDSTTPPAWVTILGTLYGRVGFGRDGITRFSVQNENGRFYIQCPTRDLKNPGLLQRGIRLIVAGGLSKIDDNRTGQHQIVVRAMSLSLVKRNSQIISLLSQDEEEKR